MELLAISLKANERAPSSALRRQKEPQSLLMPTHSSPNEPPTSSLDALDLIGRTAGTFEPAVLQEAISILQSHEDLPTRASAEERREASMFTPLVREKTIQVLRAVREFARVWEAQATAEASQHFDRREALMQSTEQAKRRLKEKLASCLADPFMDLVILEEMERRAPEPSPESASGAGLD
jgi:hypothetical protein